MSRLSLFLLGSPRLELEGVPVEFDTRKNIALIAYLAVTGRSHSRESVVTLLWPELEPSRGRAGLRRNLSTIRRALGGEWMLADRETVGTDPDADAWVDVGQFRQRLAACASHDHPPTEACPDCVPLLEEAVALYRDHFLAGFTLRDSAVFDDWQFFETEGLRDELSSALVRLASYHTAQGDFEPAIGYARRWLALDPLHEPAHRHLMMLYAQSGQRAAALRQYETCRQLLAEELDAEPSERTRETYERLLRGELPAGPTAVEAILERELRMVGECPYRGLAAFREADTPFFFGRKEFVERLEEAVETRPMVAVVVGSSGSGKSSAVYAGLLPRLRAQEDWLVAAFRPSGQPFHTLAAALLAQLAPELGETDRLLETAKLAGALSEGDVPLFAVVERALEKSAGSKRLLLLADQFEELYTLSPQPEARRHFLDTLLAAVAAAEERRASPLVLLVTMRADFMGQALGHRPFADTLQEAALIMGPMTREELRAAIEKPAEKQGAAFESGLVERILDDVGEEPGNLPLLEFALTLLWERLDFGWMTHAAYDETGRVAGALARYAEEVYGELEEGEREQGRQIFVQLVQPGEGTEDTRRVATRAEMGEGSWALVQHLADRRLVVTGRDATTGSETIEVVHEALIRGWGGLRGWMEADRAFRTWQERLRVALRVWDASERDEGALLRGTPLAEAEGWLEERVGQLSAAEREYIEAGVASQEREVAVRERRRRRTILALAGGLVVALILALLAGQQWRRAEDEVDARAAAESAALAQAGVGLGAAAVRELDGEHPERAVPLALEALTEYPHTWQAERALGQAVLGSRLRLILRHERTVNHGEWSPDGTRVATASSDGTARIWDATTGTELVSIQGHGGLAVVWVSWAPSGDRIATSGGDGAVRIWDAATGVEFLSLANIEPEGEGGQPKWSPSGDRILTFSGLRNLVTVWDANTGEISALSGHGDDRETAEWSPDGTRIASATPDGTVRVMDASSGETRLTLRGHDGLPVAWVIWSPLGNRIVTSADDGAKVWDALSGEELLALAGASHSTLVPAWSPDGMRLATIDDRGLAVLWDAGTGEELLPLARGGTAWKWAAWSPDGARILITGEDGKAKLWDTATGAERFDLVGHSSAVPWGAWSPSGDGVLTLSHDGTARVWDLAGGAELLAIPAHEGWAIDVAWSPAGDRILSAGTDGSARVWDGATGEELVQVSHEGWEVGADWSPSGDRIVTTDGRTARVWDAANGEEILLLEGGGEDLNPPRWSPAGDRIVVPRWGVAKVWDVASGAELFALGGHQNWISARWSPSGDRIFTAGMDEPARVWDGATGEELFTLTGFGALVTLGEYSPDGTGLFTHSADGIGRLWDVSTEAQVLTVGEELVTFLGHERPVWGMSWSPSGERILTSSMDGTARVWDVARGVELFRYEPGGGELWGVDWSPDGTRIAITGSDGMVRVLGAWQTAQELIETARECCVLRELTDAEREQFGLPSR